MSVNNTNIRYHLFKEFLKHRTELKESNLERINDFAIPVFSGVETSFICQLIKRYLDSESLCTFFTILGYIFVPALAYIFFYVVTYYSMEYYRNHILPCLNQTKSNNPDDKEEQKTKIAKFDYEVSDLVQSSYELITKNVEDKILNDYNFMQSIFYAMNAVEDLRKSLTPQNTISANRISYVMLTLKEAIVLQTHHKDYDMFKEEIVKVVGDFNSLVLTLNETYDIHIEVIST